jgi:predicted lipoprotein with Yx(FWY)xxD motif
MRGLLVSLLVVAASWPLAAAAAEPAVPAGVTAAPQGHGWLFAANNGMTLYTYDRDEGTPGGSACVEECAVTWPPFMAGDDAQAIGGWGFITRPEGGRQWAYKGKPVYFYALDAFPGATFGDGVGTVWRVAFQEIATPIDVRIMPTRLGQVLADAAGKTLYAADGAAPPAACDAACRRQWQPLAAPWLANAVDDWTVIAREDGLRQWAFKGQALVTYAGDVNPGETAGHGVAGHRAVVLQPPPPLPPWATIQNSDAGELIANAQGRTVYAHAFNPRNRRQNPRLIACNGECVDPEWVPFAATPEDKPVGSWTILKRSDGTLQWAYKGQRLYTHVLDKQPGDFKGIRFGGDRSFAAIMRDGQPMQGVTVGG